MSENINKELHEKVMGLCWHEKLSWDEHGYATCGKCDKSELNWGSLGHPFYTSDPAAYWKLLQKVKEHELFDHFIHKMPWTEKSKILLLLDIEEGCQAIHEYLCK